MTAVVTANVQTISAVNAECAAAFIVDSMLGGLHPYEVDAVRPEHREESTNWETIPLDTWAIIRRRTDRNANNVRNYLQQLIRAARDRGRSEGARKCGMELYFPHSEESTDWDSTTRKALATAASSGRGTGKNETTQQISTRTQKVRRWHNNNIFTGERSDLWGDGVFDINTMELQATTACISSGPQMENTVRRRAHEAETAQGTAATQPGSRQQAGDISISAMDVDADMELLQTSSGGAGRARRAWNTTPSTNQHYNETLSAFVVAATATGPQGRTVVQHTDSQHTKSNSAEDASADSAVRFVDTAGTKPPQEEAGDGGVELNQRLDTIKQNSDRQPVHEITTSIAGQHIPPAQHGRTQQVVSSSAMDEWSVMEVDLVDATDGDLKLISGEVMVKKATGQKAIRRRKEHERRKLKKANLELNRPQITSCTTDRGH